MNCYVLNENIWVVGVFGVDVYFENEKKKLFYIKCWYIYNE